jgi:hypothetical protein
MRMPVSGPAVNAGFFTLTFTAMLNPSCPPAGLIAKLAGRRPLAWFVP